MAGSLSDTSGGTNLRRYGQWSAALSGDAERLYPAGGFRTAGVDVVAEIIDGKKIAAEIRTDLKPRLEKLADAGDVPGLAAVLVGENAASQLYVKMKSKASDEMGMGHWTIQLPEDVPEARLRQES